VEEVEERRVMCRVVWVGWRNVRCWSMCGWGFGLGFDVDFWVLGLEGCGGGCVVVVVVLGVGLSVGEGGIGAIVAECRGVREGPFVVGKSGGWVGCGIW
jgi:hypothetical protein